MMVPITFSPAEEAEIRREVREHMNSLLQGAGPLHYLTTNPKFREFEVNVQETIVQRKVAMDRDVRDLYSSLHAMRFGSSKDFLNQPVYDVLDELGGKADTFDEFLDLIKAETKEYEAKHHGHGLRFDPKLSDVFEEAEEGEGDGDDSFLTALERSTVGSPGDELVPETPETSIGDGDNQVNDQLVTPATSTGSGAINENGNATPENDNDTPEMFMATPPPAKSRTIDTKMRNASKAKKQLIPKVPKEPEFPTAEKQNQVKPSSAHSDSDDVFVFQGDAGKPCRFFEPGEVLYTKDGSPVILPGPISLGSNPHTPENISYSTSARPVVVPIDDGKFSVEMVYQGKPEDFTRFREFVTDFRGFVRTRTLQQHRVQAPRVPNGPAVPKSAPHGLPKSRTGNIKKKPGWKFA